jgi:predicted nucleic acid-binding protein
MSDVVLDANVIVGTLDEGDALSVRARELVVKLRTQGHQPVFIDFLLAEALSALCRRSFERKQRPPKLAVIVDWIQEQRREGLVYFPALTDDDFGSALAIVQSSGGALNFNDARLVVMQRSGDIGQVASFDADFDGVEGFRRLA